MKTKRLVALVLALTMVFCFMAMSASAATTEIQPRATCPKCGGYGYVISDTSYPETKLGETFTCKNMSAYHAHYKVNVYITNRCATCGYTNTFFSHSYTRCPYGSL